MMTVSGESSRRMDASILRISLERSPHAPSLARAAITGFSDGRDIAASRLATLTLLVSEVVTNAVLHSGAPPRSEILLCASLVGGSAVRVEVTDGGGGFTPTPRDLTRPDGGYGLYLIEKEARAWGVDRKGGTRVWFELATQPE
jgi:anti-sigma regulatory factor (Ser/Thr protein kinase)